MTVADQPSATSVPTLVATTFRADQGRVVASLLRSFGDLDLAEESVQDAYATALRVWGTGGGPVPRNPGAWILTTARHRAIDRLRRAGRLEQKTAEMAVELDRRQANADSSLLTETVADDRLRLLFTCCHPVLDEDAQVALTLRLVAGLTTAQIAAAFLVGTPTMAARLTRAKKRVRAAGVPLRMPDDDRLGERVDAVMRVVYLAFNQAYLARGGETLQDVDLADEAVRLAKLLVRLLPEEPEAQGLLALLLLSDARRDARERGGRLVPLAEQDRGRWHADRIATGCALVESALRRGRPGPYQLQAAIQAVHAEAASMAETDWHEIAALYATLSTYDPSPVVTLNRAVAVHHAVGPSQALLLLDQVVEALDDYHLLHAVRATVLEALDDRIGARDEWSRAMELTDNAVEERFCRARLAALDP